MLLEPQAEGRFLLTARIGDESRHEVTAEVPDAAMATMLNLGDIFELIMDGLVVF